MPLPDALPAEGLPLPGASRYILRRLLGRGGFGDAYLADDEALTRPVVIKMLMNLSDAMVRERFTREARIAAKIRHPNVVQVFDIGALPDGQPYYIMEYIEGSTLTGWLRQHASTSLSVALTLIAEAAEGLHAAHKLGAIHRDVKPENILVTHDGHAKVIDFGIAKAFEPGTEGQRTAVGKVPGTPRYLSPEQAKAEALTPASDLYSLGCVMYVALTGKSVFEGTPLDLMRHHVMTPAPTLAASGCGQTFPAEIEQIVARLLAKQPTDRFQSGDELARVLRRVAQKARQAEESDATQALPPFVAPAPTPTPPTPPVVSEPSAGTVSAVSVNVPAIAAPAPTPARYDGTDLFPMAAAPMLTPQTPTAKPPTTTSTAAVPKSRTLPILIAAIVVLGGVGAGGFVLLRNSSTPKDGGAASQPASPAETPPTSIETTTATKPATPDPEPTTTATIETHAAEPAPTTTATTPKIDGTAEPLATTKPKAKPTVSAPEATTKPAPTTSNKPAPTTTAKPAGANGGALDDQY